jgi:large subunit ribosomal protein L24
MFVERGDKVLVISGDDKGKTGKVIRAVPTLNRIYIEGINLVWKHIRKSNKHPRGGRIRVEMPVSVSNIRVICQSCDKPTRVKYTYQQNPQITKQSRLKDKICVKCKGIINPTATTQ